MGPYPTLAEIVTTHAYFGGGPCPSLRWLPTGRTQAWLAGAGCIVHPTPGGLTVHADAAQADRLRLSLNDADEPPVLTWWVSAEDSLFSNFTDGLPHPVQSVLAFDSASAVPDGGPDRWRLHAAPEAGAADAAAWPGDFAADRPPATLPSLAPRFIVTLRLGPDRGADVFHYRVHFAARSPIWKYCLFGDWEQEQIRIVDLAQEAAFAPAVSESLPGGHEVVAIRSCAGIALQERPPQRFQLRGVEGAAERVLIKRLPVAGARNLARETIGGVDACISEIFVHR